MELANWSPNKARLLNLIKQVQQCMYKSQDQANHEIETKSSQKSIELRMKGNSYFKNVSHNEMDHKMTLFYYCKSIAYAPPDSEDLATAYSNRSALWLHVHKYDLCLIDIDRALKLTGSSELKDRLISRKDECVDLYLSQDTQDEHKKIELPKFNPSKIVPCVADFIKLEFDLKSGKHYVALRDIRPGEVILCEETPYSSVKYSQIYLVCSHCLSFAWAGIPCNFCVFATYCSETCKKEAWQQYHDVMCQKLSVYHSSAGDDEELFGLMYMANKIMNIFSKKEELGTILKEAQKFDKQKGVRLDQLVSEGKVNCKGFKSLYSLINFKLCDEIEFTSMDSISEKLIHIISLNSLKFQTTVPSECAGNVTHTCARNCNDFESCMMNNCTNRGRIVGPCSSFMNHSCVPNVAQVFLPGPKIVMITISPIQKGEQLCISYGPNAHGMPKQLRLEELQKTYFFNCECKACTENFPGSLTMTPVPSKIEMMSSEMSRAFGDYARMFNSPCNTWHYSEDLYKAAVHMCEFVYERFNAREAFLLSRTFKNYIQQCFIYLY
ncbi:hypothetical protein QAD02_023037, partial [Eretmocerus hayati]